MPAITSILGDLARFLSPPAAEEALTKRFCGQKHDDLLDRLRRLLEQRFPEGRVTITQSLRDEGVDLLIEHQSSKAAVQLKSHFDISEDKCREKVLAQLQASRKHGAERLFLILCGDMTDRSQRQKVGGLLSDFSQMSDPYVVPVAPENAWMLLNPPPSRLHLENQPGHAYPLSDHFSGRLPERAELTAWLTGDGPAVRVVEAIGGMGKSALAWVWANADVAGEPPDGCVATALVAPERRPDRILWWNFYDPIADFARFLEWAAKKLNLRGDNEYDLLEALEGALLERRWLLILDGFERELRANTELDGAALCAAAEEEDDRPNLCIHPRTDDFLRCLTSRKFAGRVLITSRVLPFRLDERHRLPLAGLDPADAIRLFRARDIQGTEAEIYAACRTYGFHALTIRLLTGWLAKTPGVRRDIREIEHFPSETNIKDDDRRHHVLERAYEDLSAPLRQLLGRIACFRGAVEFTTLCTLTRDTSKTTVSNVLKDLIDRGLVQRDASAVTEDRYDLHPLVRNYVYSRMPNRAEEHDCIRALFKGGATMPTRLRTLAELQPVIDYFWHTVKAGHFDEAFTHFKALLHERLYYQFAAYDICTDLVGPLIREVHTAPALSYFMTVYSNCLARSGKPRRAADILQECANLDLKNKQWGNLFMDNFNLSMALLAIGAIRESERALLRAAEIAVRYGASTMDYRILADGHLGRVKALKGEINDAKTILEDCDLGFANINQNTGRITISAYQAEAALWHQTWDDALCFAQSSRAFAEDTEDASFHLERDFIRADWLEGAALVARSGSLLAAGQEALDVGGKLLHGALAACHRIRLVELEPRILLALARWHAVRGEGERARDRAQEALALADRSEYRLDQAEAHNLLAELWKAEDFVTARDHARRAKERAWCDGPPYAYHWALQRAEALVAELGGNEER